MGDGVYGWKGTDPDGKVGQIESCWSMASEGMEAGKERVGGCSHCTQNLGAVSKERMRVVHGMRGHTRAHAPTQNMMAM